MKIALIADLHGNMPAVRALEKDLSRRGADEIWCLGDLVGKGPSSDQTCDWAFANCKVILSGNWDEGVSTRSFHNDVFYWRQLGEKRLDRLRALPREHHCFLSGRHVRLLHGRPVMPELLFVSSDQATLCSLFESGGERYQMVIYADAHRQMMHTLAPGMILNTGSVGNALGGSGPKVCYTLLDAVPGAQAAPFDFTFAQIPYNTQEAIYDAENEPDLPKGEAYRREVETGRYSR